MTRHCARPGCAEAARATFGFDYAAQEVWLADLVAEAHPANYDLCRRHAATLSVPHGWRLRDAREPAPTSADGDSRISLLTLGA